MAPRDGRQYARWRRRLRQVMPMPEFAPVGIPGMARTPTMPAMAQTFDVCIRGAGIAGRTLALLLARERLRVALVVAAPTGRSEEHTSELQSQSNLVCRLLLEKKKKNKK